MSSSSFDPYYKWLGIPPKDQPPHHYRLLGVDTFETDADVIDAAANRLMSYLQHLAAGTHARECQRLLNEVSAARLCLLDEQKRKAYEQQLRTRLLGERRVRRAVRTKNAQAPAAPPVANAAVQAPAAPPQAAPTDSGTTTYASRRHSAYQARRRRKPWGLLVVLGIVTLALVLIGIWVLTGGFAPSP